MKQGFSLVVLSLLTPHWIDGGVVMASSITPLSSAVNHIMIAQNSENGITAGWFNYIARDQSYSVKFPGQPTEENQSTDSALGILDYTIVIYQDDVNRRAYLTSNIVYSLEPDQSYDVDRGLEGAKNGALNNTNSVLLSERNITKQGVRGKEIVFRNPQNLLGKAHIYIDVKNSRRPTLYQALVISDRNINAPEINAFLHSLIINP